MLRGYLTAVRSYVSSHFLGKEKGSHSQGDYQEKWPLKGAKLKPSSTFWLSNSLLGFPALVSSFENQEKTAEFTGQLHRINKAKGKGCRVILTFLITTVGGSPSGSKAGGGAARWSLGIHRRCAGCNWLGWVPHFGY